MTYTLIAHTELTSSQSIIEFSSIPATFTDLLVVTSQRASSGSDFPAAGVRFNSATTNYSTRWLLGLGSGSGSSGNNTGTYLRIGNVPGSSQTASTFSSISVYVPNYRVAAAKSVSADAVAENNSTGGIQNIVAGLWNDTAAITNVRVLIDGFDMVSGSSATLYGITSGSSGGVVVS
jgi:hypothetical protein